MCDIANEIAAATHDDIVERIGEEEGIGEKEEQTEETELRGYNASTVQHFVNDEAKGYFC